MIFLANISVFNLAWKFVRLTITIWPILTLRDIGIVIVMIVRVLIILIVLYLKLLMLNLLFILFLFLMFLFIKKFI